MRILLVLLYSSFCLLGCKFNTNRASPSLERNNFNDTAAIVISKNHDDKNRIDTSIQNQNREDTLYNIVEKIIEVKNLVGKINAKSSNQKVSIIINKEADKEFLYYLLQVGVDDELRFQPLYNFYIKKESMEVSYYNTINDSIISLKEWRSKRGW